jgi:hypothetical protein
MVYPDYDCVCDPDTVSGSPWVRWIGFYLHDCVYTTEEIASVLLGLLNLAFWIPALFPQIIANYRTGRVDALSGWFVAQWLAGDVSNLLGCLFTNQLPTQLITSVYFVCTDFILMGQYIYYKGGKKALKRLSNTWNQTNSNHSKSTRLKLIGLLTVLSMVALTQSHSQVNHQHSPSSSLSPASRVLHSLPLAHNSVSPTYYISSSSALLCNSPPELSDSQLFLGSICAWLSGMLYFLSRFPQVIKNFQRHSVDGLSLGLFFCAVAANFCYGISIIFRLPIIDETFWLTVFPYLIGSLGTIIFDVLILTQAWMFGAFSSKHEKSNYKEIKDNPEANDTDSEYDEEDFVKL